MDQLTRDRIRHIFLSPRPSFAFITAATLLGLDLGDLKRRIEDGEIVAVSTPLGRRVGREEMMAEAMQRWGLAAIGEALGADAAAVLPEAIRLVELRARVPRYQRDMLRYFARRDRKSVDEVLARELDDLASAHAEELTGAMPGFRAALAWP